MQVSKILTKVGRLVFNDSVYLSSFKNQLAPMKLVSTIIACFSVLFILSCQTDSKPDVPKKAKKIHAKYYVRYLQAEKELKAEVSFKEGDSLATARSIVLTNVTFENAPMKVQDLGKVHGVRYASRKTGLYRDQYQFNYTSDQFGSLGHSIKMAPITDFSFREKKIKKGSGALLSWDGPPLEDNQELILLFTDEQKKAFPIQVNGPTQKSEVFLPSKKTALLSAGKGQLMLVKKQLSKSTEDNFSKISEMEFYSKNLDIEVVE